MIDANVVVMWQKLGEVRSKGSSKRWGNQDFLAFCVTKQFCGTEQKRNWGISFLISIDYQQFPLLLSVFPSLKLFTLVNFKDMWIGNFLKKLCYFIYSLFFFNCFSGAQQCGENYGNWWAYRLCYEWIDCWCSYTCWTCTSWNSGTVCNDVDDTHVYMFYFFFILADVIFYFALWCRNTDF